MAPHGGAYSWRIFLESASADDAPFEAHIYGRPTGSQARQDIKCYLIRCPRCNYHPGAHAGGESTHKLYAPADHDCYSGRLQSNRSSDDPASGEGTGRRRRRRAHDVVEASKGRQPEVAKNQITPPQIIRIDRPKLGVEPTEMVKMPDNNNTLPNFGMTQSPQIALASQGKGSGSGFGQGSGGGIGTGRGTGSGPGSGGGYGGGLMSVGGGVSAPQVIHSAEPEFTDDARRTNYQGNVSVQLIVDSEGNPQNVRLVSHLGMGLDEKAIEAVRQYRFRPAMYQGHPVSVQILIDVDFHLH